MPTACPSAVSHQWVNFSRRWIPTPRWSHYVARERLVWGSGTALAWRIAWVAFVAVFQWLHKVATNVAYYLHTPRETLSDVGYSVLPALSPRTQIISEYLFFALAGATGVFAIGSPLCYPRRGLYTSMMVLRYSVVLVIAQLLRILSFLVTSLPGPNYHCRPNSEDYNPPITGSEILSRPDPFKGCGDLVFSSHTIFVTLCVLSFHKYCASARIRALMYALLLLFGGLVIAARKHYTVDIVVAWYVVILVWISLDHYRPDKLPDELVALEDKYEADQRVLPQSPPRKHTDADADDADGDGGATHHSDSNGNGDGDGDGIGDHEPTALSALMDGNRRDGTGTAGSTAGTATAGVNATAIAPSPLLSAANPHNNSANGTAAAMTGGGIGSVSASPVIGPLDSV